MLLNIRRNPQIIQIREYHFKDWWRNTNIKRMIWFILFHLGLEIGNSHVTHIFTRMFIYVDNYIIIIKKKKKNYWRDHRRDKSHRLQTKQQPTTLWKGGKSTPQISVLIIYSLTLNCDLQTFRSFVKNGWSQLPASFSSSYGSVSCTKMEHRTLTT